MEKEQHITHCKTAEILECQVTNEKMNSNSMRNMYKNNTSVLIQERARLNVSKNLLFLENFYSKTHKSILQSNSRKTS